MDFRRLAAVFLGVTLAIGLLGALAGGLAGLGASAPVEVTGGVSSADPEASPRGGMVRVGLGSPATEGLRGAALGAALGLLVGALAGSFVGLADQALSAWRSRRCGPA